MNGQLSVVMGREENDKPRTVKIVPLEWTSLELRFLVKGTIIRGQFRATGTQEWREVGECDLPAPMGGRPKISLQFYQGAADVERWAKIKRFRILRQE